MFSKRVKLDHLQLPFEGVCVVWKWDICTDGECVSESEEFDTSKEIESEDDARLKVTLTMTQQLLLQ